MSAVIRGDGFPETCALTLTDALSYTSGNLNTGLALDHSTVGQCTPGSVFVELSPTVLPQIHQQSLFVSLLFFTMPLGKKLGKQGIRQKNGLTKREGIGRTSASEQAWRPSPGHVCTRAPLQQVIVGEEASSGASVLHVTAPRFRHRQKVWSSIFSQKHTC